MTADLVHQHVGHEEGVPIPAFTNLTPGCPSPGRFSLPSRRRLSLSAKRGLT